MTRELLPPEMMAAVLSHNNQYIRAIGLLNEDWDPDDQPIYRNVLEAGDVVFARDLQAVRLVAGRVDLKNYRAVNQLLVRHEQWFSAGARRELLRPFQE